MLVGRNAGCNIVMITAELCRETLAEDDVPEEEIEDEVALIRTQAAFCTQVMGDADKALNEYLDVLKEK